YYTTLGLAGRAMGLEGLEGIPKYRFISALFVALGIFLWVLAIRNWGGSRIQALCVIAATCAVPMFSYLAGSINNDNLAYLAVATFFFGLSLRHRFPRAAYYLGAVGVLAAVLAKATAAVFLVAFLGVWLFLRLRAGENMLKNRHFLGGAAVLAVVGGAYYACTYAVHGALFPKAGNLYDITYPQGLSGFWEYVKVFVQTMLQRLPGVMSHRSYAPLSGGMATLLYLLLLLPLVAWLVYRPLALHNERRDLSDAFLAALVLTIGLHVWVGWTGYQQTGLLAGLQPRYYSYALPALFLFAFIDGSEARIKRWLFAGFALIASSLLAYVPGASMRALAEQQAPRPADTRAALAYRAPAEAINLSVNTASGSAGYVDRVEIRDGRMTASGWAVDSRSKAAATLVWVVHEGRAIGAVEPVRQRPDVAKAMGPRALGSGFDVTIDGMPPAFEPCSLRFYAAQQDALIELKNPGCYIPTKSTERK
ncbi:MAG TPA: hypothetical protein VJ484_08175, partial [Lysobacter sp.]|nr:hypothetical protein [Lysobacter sp.]